MLMQAMHHATQPFSVPRFQDRVGAEPGPSEAFSFCGLKEKTVDVMPAFLAKQQTNAKGRLLQAHQACHAGFCWQHVFFYMFMQVCTILEETIAVLAPTLAECRNESLRVVDGRQVLLTAPSGRQLHCFCVTVVPAEPWR